MVRIILLFIIAAVNIFAQEFSVKAFTDTNVYLIGDQIRLNYQITHKDGISFLQPGFRDSINNIDIISINTIPEKKENGLNKTGYEIILSRYDSADVEIPAIRFIYWYGNKDDRAPFLLNESDLSDTSLRSSFSNPVSIRIDAVKVNMEEDIKDIKEPLTVPIDWKWILFFILLGLIILGAAYFIYNKYFRKKSSEKKEIVKLPPHVEAFNSLKVLEEKHLWQSGLIKEFHSEVTGIIRRYFEERFSLPALEMTTVETVSLLKRNKEAESIVNDTEDFFNNADLVKFAKFVPMNEVNEMMMKKAYTIVEHTIPAPVQESLEAKDVR